MPTEEKVTRKLRAILSADVKGYSLLMSDDEAFTIRTLKEYRSIMSTHIQQNNGRVVDAPGDNLLAEFSSVVDAVQCAVEIQKNLKEKNEDLPLDRRLEFRIGVNIGDVVQDGDSLYGEGVNIAARIEALADPGGVCISRNAYEHIKNKLKLGYEYIGEHAVKNIKDPVRAYKVLISPEDAGKLIGEEPKTPTGKWIWPAVVVGTIILTLIGYHVYQKISAPEFEPASVAEMAFPLPEKPSIAVLPFDNMSGDPEQDYIADGFTENIITGLSQIPAMFVIARNSVFTYKGKPVKVKQVSEELGVKYVLEGSIQKVGDRLRVNAQLIDALEGHHLWADRYDRDLKDLFNLQDDITMKIVTALEVKLTRGEILGARDKTDSFEAWSHLPKGFSLLNRGTVEDLLKARKHFEKAVNLDPDYAYAWTLLAWTYTIEVIYGGSESPGESIKRSFDLAQKAAALDENQAGIHSLMCRIYGLQGKYDEAIAEGKKSVALAPNSARAHIFLAESLHIGGRPEEAIVHAKKAMRLEPYYPAWFLGHLAGPYEMVGRYEEAIAIWKKFLERALRGEFPPIYLHERLAISHARLGRMKEAQAHAAEILKIKPDYTVAFYRNRKTRAYKDKAYLENQVDLLHKAGLPDKPPLPLPDKPSIAVLAFDNLSGDPEQEYFSDGIAENIITALSKVGELFVIARNSSFTYKGKPVKVQQVGRELGVRYVLEGSLQKSGDRVRITAQLIDAKNGQHLWAEKYDRVLEDIFEIQDDIAKRVVSSLQVNLTIGEIARAYAKGTNNLEAYLKVMQARSIHMRFTKDDNLISRSLTEEAISIDPEYGEAYVLLAATYMLETFFESVTSRKQSMRQAIGYAKKAVELETVGGHGMLGWLYSLIGQIDKALTECKLAVDLAPNSATALTWYGAVSIKAGHYEMAVQQLEQAGRRDPMAGTWFLRNLGNAYSLKGRHEEAISTLKKAIQKAPKDYLSRLLLTRAYIFAVRPDEAKVEAAEVLRLNPNFLLEKYAKTYKAKDKDRSIDALRQAGLK